ncbi:MAG: hypothetical protein LBD91_00530 [Prevotellaceae bacterium]|nr:hypothetical protein [Prevotellaceae bacterium]
MKRIFTATILALTLSPRWREWTNGCHFLLLLMPLRAIVHCPEKEKEA